MKFNNLKHDKGVAGLTVFLSLIVILFVIGLLVTIFALMGGELIASDTISAQFSETTTQATVLIIDGAGTTLTKCNGANQGVITSINEVNNNSVILTATNYTFSGCAIIGDGSAHWNNSAVSNVTYTFTKAGETWDVMNDTVAGVGESTDWFSIFIVIGAMVVLILLTVIIITAIRGSGLVVSEGSGKGNRNIGSA